MSAVAALNGCNCLRLCRDTALIAQMSPRRELDALFVDMLAIIHVWREVAR